VSTGSDKTQVGLPEELLMSNQAGSRVLLVTFRAKPGREQDFIKLMHGFIPSTRAEPGNRQFEFYRDQADPLNFMLYEEFVNEAALDTHRARPEHATVLEDIKPMLDGAPVVTPWSLALTNAGTPSAGQGDVGHVTLVHFRMKPDGVDGMLDAVGSDFDQMQGNVRFDLNRELADPLNGMICARWVSRAIWQAHNAKPHFKVSVERMAPCLATPLQRTLWQPALS
jgi:quinol monooxygenase YgiN